jgi:fatty-acyl-CoA synthase
VLNAEMTLQEALQDVVRSRREREALVCADVRLTYDQLLASVLALARGLHGLGVRRGDRVVCALPPGPEFACLFFAVAEVGAVVVPISPQLRPRGAASVLRDAEPVMLVASRPIGSELLAEAGRLRHLVCTAEGGEDTTWADLVAAGEGVSLPSAGGAARDLLALIYTSGTTGEPKGTMHTHRSLIAPVVASVKLRELWLRRPSLRTLGKTATALARYRGRLLQAAGRPQTFLSTVGWHTITGLEVMLQGLLMGDRLVVMPRFHPREALRLVEQERVTVLVAVPMALEVILRLQEREHHDTSSLLICGTGASPCPPELAREIQRSFGCAVHIGFGATETAGGIAATSLADSDERQAETVGRPMPGVEVRIVDEQRRELPPGQVGELACRSDGVMLGYYGAPQTTAQVMDESGWYYTGDLGYVDAQGYLHIVGRKRDVINRAGQNVYPAEIEAYLNDHPAIRESAVVGVPSPVGGEAVIAFILCEEEAEVTVQEVLDYCRVDLEPWKIPSRVRIVPQFPRTETGKPQKFRLRQMALRETQGGES